MDISYAIVNDTAILGFFNEYRFLSNFHLCEIDYEGIQYTSTEAAYQAAKAIHSADKYTISRMTPSDARKHGQTIEMRSDWNEVKWITMAEINFQKYARHIELREKLLATGDKYLEETNHWKDVYWGVNYNTMQGANQLGKILMRIRQFWK
jgi:ribA/ribD-fused uncharacterized protein